MQIQPQSNVNFNGKEHITSPQKLAGMIRHLESKGKCYKHHGDHIYWGKDLTKLIKELKSMSSDTIELSSKIESARKGETKLTQNELDALKYEKFDIEVGKAIQKWQDERALKKAQIAKLINAEKIKQDELLYGKKIGTQELRLKLKKNVLA